jgi:hypothetical protein
MSPAYFLNPWTHVGGGGSGTFPLMQFTVVQLVQLVTQALTQPASHMPAWAFIFSWLKTEIN